MSKSRFTTRQIALAGIIAAIYAVMSLLSSVFGIAYGPIQCRFSEALTVLPFLFPKAVTGLFIGCVVTNLMSTVGPLDIIFGSLATLLGAIGTRLLRKNRWLACLPPILSNTIIVPIVLTYAYGIPGGIPWLMLTVGIGEILSCGLLGQLLWGMLDKHKAQLFK